MAIEPSRQTLAHPRNPRAFRKAVDVEELLRWTYQDQAADAVVGRAERMTGPGAGRDSLIAVGRNGTLGTHIDGGGPRLDKMYIHPDAEAVHDAVRTLRPTVRIGLVIQYAKMGDRPDWMPGAVPTPLPIRRGNGKPVIVYHDDKCRRPSHCLLRYDPLPEHLDFAREVYAEWWRALSALVGKLAHLEAHRVTGPLAKRSPWHVPSP